MRGSLLQRGSLLWLLSTGAPGCDLSQRKDDLLDPDGDGWDWPEDCDNADSGVLPDAVERCDGVDNDCDGTVDEGDAADARAWYADADGDGHGDAGTAKGACAQPSGYVATADDCDDLDASTHPGAVELCEDGVLNDCDSDPQAAWEACGLTGSASLSEADLAILGEQEGDQAGCALALAGDVDGDGLSDLLVGAYLEDAGGEDAGASYLLLGGGALASGGSPLKLGDADLKLIGEAAGDESGWRVSGAGDVDGDGLDDLLIGVELEDSGGSNAGAAYLVLAESLRATALTSMSLSAADLKFIGEGPGDRAGYTVASAGDVDGDGLGEVLIGALYEETGGTNAGAVYLVLGSSMQDSLSAPFDLSGADLKLTGEQAYDDAGVSLSNVGDVDGDGLVDFVVGAYTEGTGGDDAGAAYLLYGGPLGDSPAQLDLRAADLKLVGEAANDHAGTSVAGARDVDGDGLAEVLVGAYLEASGAAGAGAAYLLLGGGSLNTARSVLDLSESDVKLTGEAESDWAGYAVSGAGDFDGDGLSEVVVGAPRERSAGIDAGASYLLLGGGALTAAAGTLGLGSADAKLLGVAADDGVGVRASGAGDVDGDGLDEFLVGADREDAGGTDAGAAYLLFGRSF